MNISIPILNPDPKLRLYPNRRLGYTYDVGSKLFSGVRYTVYPADHLPRHVHAFVGDGEVIIVLEFAEVSLANRPDAVRGGATLSDVRKALRLAGLHLAELLELWENMHG